MRKYSVKTATRDLVDSIVKKTSDTESELKTRTQSYTQVRLPPPHPLPLLLHCQGSTSTHSPHAFLLMQVKNSLNAVERSQTGSLLARNLAYVLPCFRHMSCTRWQLTPQPIAVQDTD